jgi:ribosomal protein L37AE/L43A
MMRDALTLETSSATSNDNDSEKGSRKDDAKQKAKKKRVRRTATEIERNWKCDLCGKSYGSEGALKTHLKLKHPGVKIPKKEDIYGGTGPARYLPSQTAVRCRPHFIVATKCRLGFSAA